MVSGAAAQWFHVAAVQLGASGRGAERAHPPAEHPDSRILPDYLARLLCIPYFPVRASTTLTVECILHTQTIDALC